MDKKIEVDPKLFITCRLCLDELGIYQIVPAVKEQITYCFNINVEPYDGLPQLICKKCEGILNNYYAIKKTIVSKQNDLIKKIRGLVNIDSLADPVKGLNESHDSENNDFPKSKRLSNKRRISSSSSDESDNVARSTTNDNYEEEQINKESSSWKKLYKKMFVCRVCDMQWSSSKAVLGHFNSRHYTLRKKYKHIFKNHCGVMMYRFNEHPNITGSHKNIVLDLNKIITNVNSRYYIRYCHKGNNEVSESSDDDKVVKHKKQRLYSRGSTDTVVLEGSEKSDSVPGVQKESQKTQPSVSNECINIDDSSESEPEDSETPSISRKLDNLPETVVSVKVNLDAFSDIITACKNKYRKKRCNNDIIMKFNKSPVDLANQLKRKVLSVGRKVINRLTTKHRLTYCIPLLRFMDHKNLDVIWQSRSVTSDVDSNVIRLISRVKTSDEINLNESGWTEYDSQFPNATLYRGTLQSITNCAGTGFSAVTELNGINASSCAILTQNESACPTDMRKLLNANPVANPKQLPKKIINAETKAASKKQVPNLEVAHNENDHLDNMHLPIITSTTSLAPMASLPDKIINIYENDSESTGTAEMPRIKVKSVAELMSKETLSWMQDPRDVPRIMTSATQLPVQNEANTINVCVSPHVNMYQNLQPQAKNYNPGNFEGAQEDSANRQFDYVILDTFELPNTKTNSPFDYFRKLLRVHNITLLDMDAIPNPEFSCLLKFKVLFQQEPNKSVPVVLSLSLFCLKNLFLLTIKDRNQENINIGRISANWQWEVLKVYRSAEVVGRILSNAQKVSSEVYDFTNSFLCLLKSINYARLA